MNGEKSIGISPLTKDIVAKQTGDREVYLASPVVKPRDFGDEPYLVNLDEVYKLVLTVGISDHMLGKSYKWLHSTDDKENVYKGNVGIKTGRQVRDDGYIHISVHNKNNNTDGQFVFFSNGSVSGEYIKDDGTSVFFDRVFCQDLNTDHKIFLNSFTKKVVEGLGSFWTDDNRQHVISEDNYENPDKNSLLHHLRLILQIEKKNKYNIDSSMEGYLSYFMGLEGTLKYIEGLVESNKVVDIGTGSGKAWSELSKNYGKKLDFWATNLIYKKELIDIFGKKIVVTPVEFMKGFNDESVGGVVAMRSIAYSKSPEMTIKRINEILVPGGILKASFRSPKGAMKYGFQTHHRFSKALLELGYDVVVDDDSDTIIMGIKPGGKEKAMDVFKKDLMSLKTIPPSDEEG